MKLILVFLSFCLVLNFISAFETFSPELNQQANNVSNIYHAASHLQGLVYQQLHHSHNNTIAHHQSDTINNKNNQEIQQNPSDFQGDKYQSEEHLRDTTVTPYQMNSIDNRVIHPRFRSLAQTQRNNEIQSSLSMSTTVASNWDILSIFRNNIQRNQLLLADESAIITTTKSSNLAEEAQTQQHISFDNDYYRQKIKAFFEHQHDKSTPRARFNIKTGL